VVRPGRTRALRFFGAEVWPNEELKARGFEVTHEPTTRDDGTEVGLIDPIPTVLSQVTAACPVFP